MAELEVERLWVSDKTRAKLIEKRDLDADVVEAALVGFRLPFRRLWSDEHRKWKYQVITAIDGVAHVVVLYPHETGTASDWDLASAYPDPLGGD